MRRVVGVALLAAGMSAGTAWAGSEAAIDLAARGAAVYKERCATCHDNPRDRIPPRFVLSRKTTDQVTQALTTGVMRQQAEGLAPEDIAQLAMFLTYKQAGTWALPDPQANRCRAPLRLGAGGGAWTDWGGDPENTRFAADPGLTAAEVPRLKLKWAFAYPSSEAVGQPTRAGDLLLVPTTGGTVFALDARSGCTHWTFEAGAPVKAGIAIGSPAPGTPPMAYFGDMAGFVHALDAATGRALWKVRPHEHPLAQVRGSPKLYKGRLYAPVSSGEESAAVDPGYPCCTFRGALVALDATTGQAIWTGYTIPDEPTPLKKNSAGTQMHGPSGAGIWVSPTIDAARNRVYVGTGNGYSGKDPGTLDAVVAFDLDGGRRLWSVQPAPGDVYVVCAAPKTGNCPDEIGPDVDFGAAMVLRTLPDGRPMLLAGQKSGMAYGIDPVQGRLVWQAKLGDGGAYGGIQFGMAAAPDRLFVPLSDVKPTEAVPMAAAKPRPEGGLFALDMATGKRLWHTPAPKPVCSWGEQSCSAAQPGAATAMPGIVFSGSLDGHIRAYSAADGKVVWAFDTGRTFDAVNGDPAKGIRAHGGAVTGYGQIVAGGMLYVNSGGGYYGPAGNALLAFTVDGK